MAGDAVVGIEINRAVCNGWVRPTTVSINVEALAMQRVPSAALSMGSPYRL